jgi:hypothetical protein
MPGPDGRFVPGESGNRRGRPRGHFRTAKTTDFEEVQALANDYGPKVFRRLIALCGHSNPSVAVRACTEVLNRAYGLPRQALEVTEMAPVVVTRASREDIAHALSELRAHSPALIAAWEERTHANGNGSARWPEA